MQKTTLGMGGNRNPTVDVARGMAILIVILGHCFYSLEHPLNKMILSFHKPLFFFLSGMVAKSYSHGQSRKNYFFKKVRTLLIPQITLGVITIVYDVLFTAVMKKGSLLEIDYLYCFWRWWFLEVLFVTTLVFYYLSSLVNINGTHTKITIILIDVVLIGLFVYVIPYPSASPFYLNVVPMAFLFYFGGYLSKTVMTKEVTTRSLISLAGSSLLVLVVFSQMNSSVTMYNNNYGNVVFFFVSSAAGITLVWCLAGILKKSKVLRWFGVNSIIVYVWQFKLAEFWKNIVEIMVEKRVIIPSDMLMTIVAFIASVICVVPIVVFSNKFFPYIYGKTENSLKLEITN